ncbi:MAG: GDP-mannose 4,6-dehydratase [Bacteroidota bacterium]
MRDKLLVFGSGFLVKHIAGQFLSTGGDVCILYNEHTVPGIDKGKQVKRKEGNTLDILSTYQPGYLLFATGDSFVSDNIDIGKSITKNVMDTLGTLEIIFQNHSSFNFIKKILVIGSAAEYGREYQNAIAESTPTHPTSIYGLTKIFLYDTSMYYAWKGLPVVHVRQFNAIGPFQRDVFVLSSFCKQIAMIEKGLKEPQMTVGNLLAERDFIDVRDAANAYCLLFDAGVPGHVYNLASGISFAIEDLLDILLELTTYKEKSIRIERTVDSAARKNMLASRLLADTTKLKELGFKPQYTLRQTVGDTLNFWRQNV